MVTQKEVFKAIVACKKLKNESPSAVLEYISGKFKVTLSLVELKNQKLHLTKCYKRFNRKKSWDEVAELGDDKEF